MNHKKHKPYKITPPPLSVYRLPATNLSRKRFGFVPCCPRCGESHGLPIKELKPGDVSTVYSICEKGASELTYKLHGSIPPKYRTAYEASMLCLWSDPDVSIASHKRAKAFCNKAEKRARKIERGRRAILRGKTQSESIRNATDASASAIA